MFPGNAQDAQHYRLTVAEGLSGNMVTCIQRGPQGRIWIGTSSGLNAYDGHELEVLLPEAAVHAIAMLSDSTLWVSTSKGLHAYDVIQRQLEPVGQLGKRGISILTPLGGDTLLLANRDTLFAWTGAQQLIPVFSLHSLPDSGLIKSAIKISDVTVSADGSIWVSALNAGAIQLNRQFAVQQRLLFAGWVESIGAAPDSSLWLQSTDFLLTKAHGEAAFQPTQRPSAPDTVLRDFAARISHWSANGMAWFSGTKRSYLLAKDVARQRYRNVAVEGVDFSKTTCFFDDPHGVLWVGTENGAVAVYAPRSPFTTYLDRLEGPFGVASLRGMTEDKATGALYIASYSGLFVLAHDSLYRIPYGKRNDRKAGIPDTRHYELLDEPEYLWSASESYGLMRYDKRQQDFIKFQHDQDRWLLAMALLRDHRGRLWLGSRSGLYLADEEHQVLHRQTPKNEAPGETSIFALHEDRKQRLWLGTAHGLLRYDPASATIVERFNTDAPVGRKLSHNHVLDLHEDAEGYLWIATKGGGICRLQADSGTVRIYSEFASVDASRKVASMVEDDAGNLWLGTFNGLVQFDKASGTGRTWFARDGLTDAEFNHKAAVKRSDGRVCFGGVRGLNCFDPADLAKGTAPDLHVTALAAYDNREGDFVHQLVPALRGHTLQWPAAYTHFTLRFALSDLTDPERNRYAYRIVGWADEWQDLGRQHALRITTPPAGSYVLEIKGLGGTGVWSAPATIRLTIAPPFYQRPLFWIGTLVALALLVWGVVQWRLRQLKQANLRLEEEVASRTREISVQKSRIEEQAQQLLEMDRLKSRFFANVSHELRTPLTLINGYIDRLFHRIKAPEHREELGVALRNGRQLQGLVEEILDLSKIDAHKLEVHTRNIELVPFLSVIMDGFQSEAQHRKIAFSLETGEALPHACLLDDNKLGKILNNLLSNAFKFTGVGGAVTLGVHVSEAQLHFSVTDTGRGIHPDDLPHVFDRYYQTTQQDQPLEGGTGIGLAFSRELSLLLKGALSVSSQLGKGSRFDLVIPLAVSDSGVNDEVMVEAAASQVQAPARPAQAASGAHILLVEDNPDMQAFIRVSLGDDFAYHLAADGVEALEVLAAHPVDLVVTDLMMPRLDGFQLVERIRAEPKTRHVPVVLLTARAALEDRLQGLTLGVDDYLTKPFDAQELRVRIDNLLQNQQQRQASLAELANPEEQAESVDQAFVRQARELVLANLEDNRFGVMDLAEGLLVSQRSLTRKMRGTTGLSPLKFIQQVRLERARQLLEARQFSTVAEVMHAVGIQSGGYFARQFEAQFGKKPSAYYTPMR